MQTDGGKWQQKIVIIKSQSLSVSAAVRVLTETKKKKGERPRWGEMIHPEKISAWSSAHPVCQQFPSFNALMFRRQRDQDHDHDHAHAEKRDDDGQMDGATKPRQCHPLCRLDGIINAYSGLPFGHRQTPGSGNQDPGCKRLESEGAEVRGSLRFRLLKFERRAFNFLCFHTDV